MNDEPSILDGPDIRSEWAAIVFVLQSQKKPSAKEFIELLVDLLENATGEPMPNDVRVQLDGYSASLGLSKSEIERKRKRLKRRLLIKIEGAKLAQRIRHSRPEDKYENLLAEHAAKANVSPRTLERAMAKPGIRRREVKS